MIWHIVYCIDDKLYDMYVEHFLAKRVVRDLYKDRVKVVKRERIVKEVYEEMLWDGKIV